MKKSSVLLVVLIGLSCTAGLSAAEQYETYLNARFGYSVQYPDIFAVTQEPDNDDGIAFEAKDKKYSLSIWGAYNVLESNGESLLKDSSERVEKVIPNSGKSGADFYSIEYTAANEKNYIFYEYGIVNEEMIAAFVLKYPKSEEKRFAEIKKVMTESLKFTNADEQNKQAVSDLSVFELKDGRVVHKGNTILDCEVYEANTEGPIRYWSVFGQDTPVISGNSAVAENETGVWFFSSGGVCLAFVPLDNENAYQGLVFSPSGENFVLSTGSGVRADMTCEVYGEGAQKIGELAGLRNSIQWLDGTRFICTRIDDIRENGVFPGLAYGLKFSAVIYDAAMREEFVLKETTNTQNYLFNSVSADGASILLAEEYVESEKDWSDEGKVKTREIKVDVTAAG